MEAKKRALERQIKKIHQELGKLGPLQSGSLSEQYNVCGKAKCGCKESPPRKHGPYHQLSFNRNGKSSTRFVRKEDVSTVKRQLRDYARLKELTKRWVELSTELCEIEVGRDTGTATPRPKRKSAART